MFVELIESLRCPRPHDESQLVLAARKSEERHVIQGVLGCPTCNAEFVIVGGITTFEIAAKPTPQSKPDTELGLRIAAFLELTDAKGFAILFGAWGAQSDPVQRVAETPLLLVNPPVNFGGEPAGVILCGESLPLAASSARAAALDASMSAAQVAAAVRAVRTGGRLIGPVSLTVPAGVNEITRDASLWVGEKAGATPLVVLSRGPTANPAR